MVGFAVSFPYIYGLIKAYDMIVKKIEARELSKRYYMFYTPLSAFSWLAIFVMDMYSTIKSIPDANDFEI